MSQSPVMAPEPDTPPEEPGTATARKKWPLVLAVVAVVLVVGVVVGVVMTRSQTPAEAIPFSAPGEPYQKTLERAVDDLTSFWEDELPVAYGVEYEGLRHGLVAFGTAEPPPACGAQTFSYDDMADNAYYCPPQPDVPKRDVASGDYIAYDEEGLIPRIAESFGGPGVAAILAHEWGHVIQNRAGVSAEAAEAVELELQGDCLAGSWAHRVANGDSPYLSFTEGDGALAAAALLTLRDPAGSDPTAESAHGSGFDRVAAFQVGFVRGAQGCAERLDDGFTLTQEVFSDVEDFATQGNAPLEDMPSLVFPELEKFWQSAYADAFPDGGEYEPVANVEESGAASPDCQGGAVPLPVESHRVASYCPATDTLSYSLGPEVADLHSSLGDSAVALALADRWGFAMRHKAGSNLDGVEAGLRVDCTSGAFFRSVHDADVLSPGDLDEAVASLLSHPWIFESQVERGHGFVRVGAFHLGFTAGIAACSAVSSSGA